MTSFLTYRSDIVIVRYNNGLVVYAETQEEKAWFDATGECAWVDC